MLSDNLSTFSTKKDLRQIMAECVHDFSKNRTKRKKKTNKNMREKVLFYNAIVVAILVHLSALTLTL